MERRWTVELKAQPGAVDVVESVTLDRLDAQGIMRWQDNLPLQVLDNKRCWHVAKRVADTGAWVEQARTHPQDRWQVTFKLRDASGAADCHNPCHRIGPNQPELRCGFPLFPIACVGGP